MVTAFAVNDLSKSYGPVPVLDGVSLSVTAGTILAVTGANGSGKSTLLECLAGSAPFDTGHVWIHGTPANPSSTKYWEHVLAILNDFTWLPDYTIEDHFRLIETKTQSVKRARPQPDRVEDGGCLQADEALRRFDVDGLAMRMPDALSSGQRQRAALTMLLVRPWTVLLLDEPERHLDEYSLKRFARVLRSAVYGRRAAIVATHSRELIHQLNCSEYKLHSPAT